MSLVPTTDEIIKGTPSLGARETGLVDLFPFRYELDLGTMLDDADDDQMISDARDFVTWGRTNVKGHWAWFITDRPMDNDVRNILIVSFDSKDDAMLTRMTWLDLRSPKGANNRGLPRKA